MRKRSSLLLAGVSIVAVSAPAGAQTPASAEGASAEKEFNSLEEIVVTARRREESLQEVPQTINVVTAAQIENLNIRTLTDIQALVPGLTLSGGGSFSTSATVRGVAFNVEASGNNPTVEFYLNDTPIASNFLFQSMFDVGQFELLRGPQGTLRGRAAPSGSITLTTRRPDLGEFGGVGSSSITDAHSYKYDAAINIPIIKEMLAVRFAGVSDENEGSGVETIKRATDRAHNPETFRDTEGVRASLRFEPADWFALNFMYQTLAHDNLIYEQVQSASLVTGEPHSGVLIRPYDLLSIEDHGTYQRQDQDVYIWNADLRFAGQKLSYAGTTNKQDFASLATRDPGDYFAPPRFPVTERAFTSVAGSEAVCEEQGREVGLVPTNGEFFGCTHGRAFRKSHELRLASEERIAGIFDYVVGALYDVNDNPTRVLQETPLLASPTTLARISLTSIVRNGDSTEKSGFGNLTAHIGDSLELSGGLRYINYENFSSLIVGGSRPTPDTSNEDSTTIYSGSAKYRFNDDLMIYATGGTSWRPGVRVVGNFSVNLTPREAGFMNLPPEESTSYEAGLKMGFLDGRGGLNLSVYRQDFDDYVYRGAAVYYVNHRQVSSTVVAPEVGTFAFVAGVPVKVEGIEAEASFRITPRWSISSNISYADGRIEDGLVACTDLNGDGVADINAARPTLSQLQAAVGPGQNVSQCRFSGRATLTSRWSANLQSQAGFSITDRLDAFVRGLATYMPENSRSPTSTFDDVESYAVLNLYTGLRDPDGRWEVSVFAKNVFDEKVILNQGASSQSTGLTTLTFAANGAVRGSTSSSFSSPYHTVGVLAERELGVSVRVGFGSR